MKNLVVSICSIISIFIGVKTLYGKEIANLNDARPVYVNILKHCGATQLRFLKDFGILIIATEKVDLNCFHKKLSSHPSARGNSVGQIINSKIISSAWDNSKAKLITYHSLFAEKGGEVKTPSPENIIIDKSLYYFVLGNRLGVATKLIKNNRFHILVEGSQYDQNYLFNTRNTTLVNLGSGKVKFNKRRIIKYSVKGYLAGNGGAFWFNAELNYQGKIIALFDIQKYTECYPYSKFKNMSEQFRIAFRKQNLKKLCVKQN